MIRHIIAALLITLSAAGMTALHAAPLKLKADAPDRYIVVPGDTLWDISSKYLQEPFRWPELWRLNRDQVQNPHRIYPGDVLFLDRTTAEPRLRLGKPIVAEPRQYESPLNTTIPPIPVQAIDPFLSQPLLIEPNGLDSAGRIVATQEEHVGVGKGDVVYAVNLKPGFKRYNVFREGRKYIDPDSQELLGYEAFYLGSAEVTRPGDVATLELLSAKEEIGRGDNLLPAPQPDVARYVPHAPDKQVVGRLLSVYGGVDESGRYQIVSLSKGARDGLEIGHVLALYRVGETVTNTLRSGNKETVTLPDERYGLIFVFRVFDRVSYALVMESSRPVKSLDRVRTP